MKFHEAQVAEKEKERKFLAEQEEKKRQFELEKERIRVVAEKEQREHETAKLMQAKLAAEQATAQAKLAADSAAEQAKLVQEQEELKLAKERELEELKLAKERELEELKHAHEMEKMHEEFKLSEAAKQNPTKGVKKVDTDNSIPGFIKAPKMPYFEEEKDFMDSYLNRFEKFATSQNWDESNWALCLSPLLRGRALDVYSMMSKDDVNDYKKLKSALLKRYQLTADGFRKRFRSSRPEPGESPVQFITHLENYLLCWVELSGTDKTVLRNSV